jgi:hypothetical protein
MFQLTLEDVRERLRFACWRAGSQQDSAAEDGFHEAKRAEDAWTTRF